MPIAPERRTPTRIVRKRPSGKSVITTAKPYQISARSAGASVAIDRPGLFMFTLLVIYGNLYVLGATILRRKRRFLRHMRVYTSYAAREIGATVQGFAQWLGRSLYAVVKRIFAPYARIGNYYQYQKPFIRQKRLQQKLPIREYAGIAGLVLKLLLHILFSLLNYAIPVVALVFLVSTVSSVLEKPVGLRVSYEIDGKVIDLGYVHSEKDYEAATQHVLDRVISDGEFPLAMNAPIFTLQELDSDTAFTEPQELADNIIKASGAEVEMAFGVYINDVFYGAVTKSTPLLNEFDIIKKSSSSGKANERTEFDKKIYMDKDALLYPKSSIATVETVLARVNRLETYDEVYIVQAGDSPSLIADKLNIPYALLKEMNPDIEEGVYVGDEIYSARARPFLSVRSIFTDVYEEEYPFEVIETQNATYARGYRSVTQEGVPGVRKVTADVTTLNGIEISREILDSTIVVAPVPERVIVGVNNPQAIISSPSTDRTPSASAPSSTGFIWPAASGYISCYMGEYYGHSGIDIASKAGTPIYASASGTVVFAKNSNIGYGRHIIIDHGNGYQTLYGHNSELYVSVGDVVAQGQVIAAMGRTGRATGNHVHFEVRLNGKYQNPVNYVGRG